MALMAGRMLSRADLDALPDDGLRHELIDGSFVMTPAPEWPIRTSPSRLPGLCTLRPKAPT